MDKFRAIPNGYMTVGELAKRMGTTVRTLQYYDKEGLLSPSASSEGGRRLYTDKDMVMLHQILSLKSLGFSLDDIKNRLISLDTPEEVSKVLEEQATALKMQMLSMSETLNAIETLRAEVLQINTVDFKKYADIIVNLQLIILITELLSILMKKHLSIAEVILIKIPPKILLIQMLILLKRQYSFKKMG